MSDRPVRPLLRLKISPRLEGVPSGGSIKILDEHNERTQRLRQQVRTLASRESGRTKWFGSHALLQVRTDERCRAPSWAPTSLFSKANDARIIAPWPGGYLAEIGPGAEAQLLAALRSPTQKVAQDASTITGLVPVQEQDGPGSAADAWRRRRRDAGPAVFVGTPAPFQNRNARVEVAARLRGILAASRTEAPTVGSRRPVRVGRSDGQQDVLATRQALAAYEAGRYSRVTLTTASLGSLLEASSSGAIVRWDPVFPLAPAEPGLAPVPDAIPDLDPRLPIVGLLDGGLSSHDCDGAISWRAEPFVPAAELDTAHGDGVARLIIDAHVWNERLQLPPLQCRIGVAPMVPRLGYRGPWGLEKALAYIDRVVAAHPDTKVWNLSANEPNVCDPIRVSDFGHQLNLISRRHGVLFVISAGNRARDVPEIIAPPADNDAALTVGGRQHLANGTVGGPCDVSRTGRGPDDMLKPELSWFSVQRVGPEAYSQASSWAAPLVSRLAAHTWARLREPSADLVKALLICSADHDEHRLATGFGSPVDPVLPWLSGPDAVLLTWTGDLKDRQVYTWEGIRLPPNLVGGGKFRGRVRLVAILEPATIDLGYNYFSTRLQTSVRYMDGKGKWQALVGSLNTDTEEMAARAGDDKWQPIRFDSRSFPRGKTVGRPELRVQARMFWRDLCAHPGIDPDTYEGRVTFVMSVRSLDNDYSLHDQFVDAMGAQVEAEVVTTDIDVQAE